MIRYKLDDLGWFQFESLIQSLLKVRFGMGIESWGGRGDHGRDAFFNDSLRFSSDKKEKGPFFFQVKFIEEANAAGAKPRSRLILAVRAEICELFKRKQNDKQLKYCLVTNVNLSPKLRSEVKELFKRECPKFKVYCWGAKDICDILDNHPNIRSAFPQILGLRDLDTLLLRVVSKPAIERSKAMIEAARELSKVFYPTDAYNQCLQKLAKHYFAVLEGPPEVGKTSIAIMIGLARLSNGWDAHECLLPDEFFQLYASDRSQIFIADDAFGSTEYDPSRTNEWSLNLDRIIRRLDNNHLMIWTARKHILQFALEKLRLQGKAENFPKPGALLVDAGALEVREKALILYRHAKNSSLDEETKKILKTNANKIVNNEHFTPERIRRFIKSSLPNLVQMFKTNKIDEDNLNALIQKEIREPTLSLKQAFQCLDLEHKDLLISRLDLMKDVIYERKDFQAAFTRHRHNNASKSYDTVEDDLALSFLKPKSEYIYFSEGWVHPSMRDMVIDYLIANESERKRFLKNCSLGGITLALSFAGGDEGKRIFPFIINDEDSRILKHKIEEVIKVGDAAFIEKLFTFINEAMSKLNEMEGKKKKYISELLALALNCIIERWRSDQSTINNDLLELYFEMAMKAQMYFPSPPLEKIWNKSLKRLDEVNNDGDREKVLESHTIITDFIELAEIIEKNEPRFLSHVKYPECVIEKIKNYLAIIQEEAESHYSFVTEDQSLLFKLYDEEKEKYAELAHSIEKIQNSSILSENDQILEKVLEEVESAQSYYERLAEENYMPDEDYRGDVDMPEATDHNVSVEQIFSDL